MIPRDKKASSTHDSAYLLHMVKERLYSSHQRNILWLNYVINVSAKILCSIPQGIVYSKPLKMVHFNNSITCHTSHILWYMVYYLAFMTNSTTDASVFMSGSEMCVCMYTYESCGQLRGLKMATDVITALGSLSPFVCLFLPS